VVVALTALDAPTPRCWLCDAPDVIRAEGEQRFVCRRCLASMARIADDPYSGARHGPRRLLVGGLGLAFGWWPALDALLLAVPGRPDVIRAEGEQRFVCRRCLASMARIADDPYSVPVTVRERLLALARRGGHRRRHLALDLPSSWPSTGDARLMRGGAA
jgi:DNA-directed RNA polymerase subunit N (RpoN/RPB10)